MEENNNYPQNGGNRRPRPTRQPRRGFNWFSLIYLFLQIGRAHV